MSLTDNHTLGVLRERMRALFGVEPAAVRFVRAPYRVCPLGAHIDHQLGTVTAMAIDQAVQLAYVPSGSPEVRLASLNYDGQVGFRVDNVPPKIPGDWGNYARGAAQALNQLSPLRQGIIGITSGDWSEGGLSSSSAIGVAYLLALEDANARSNRRKEAQISITPIKSEPPYVGCYGLKSAANNIQLDQYIENQYLGLNNGILDQAAILCSRQDHLTVIDCLAYANKHGKPTVTEPSGIRLLPRSAAMPPFVFLVVFSGLTKSLVTTAYNLRVQECAAAARILLDATGRPEAPSLLGQVTPAEYDAGRHLLSGAPVKRAAHFFSESARVRAGLAAWQQGDLPAFGRLLNESCQSSIENYECGSPPLIDLWRILSETPGIHGARFSGAGFRGCCVALAKPAAAAQAGQEILAAYARRHPELAASARALVCQSADGAGIVVP